MKTKYKKYTCPCGKTKHYADANCCTNCGRKIEEAVATAPSKKTHL